MASETIVAIATGLQQSGIGIIRLSGIKAYTIAKQVVTQTLKPRYATKCGFFDEQKQRIDSGIAIYFPNPHSFTGEDVVEFHSHGSPAVLSLLQDTLIHFGAIPAQAGEFSKRAFLNNKIDLTEAEAIASLIAANSKQEVIAINRTMQGEFANCVLEIAASILQLRIEVEAYLDFPEEEIELPTIQRMTTAIDTIKTMIVNLTNDCQISSVDEQAFQLTLIGAPNVGKSSLLNALLQQDRAIVSNEAGTTRDTIIDQLNIANYVIKIVDTAGIQSTNNSIEAIGISKTIEQLNRANHILWLQSVDSMDDANQQQIANVVSNKPHTVIYTKVDLLEQSSQTLPKGAIAIASKYNIGMQGLKDYIKQLVSKNDAPFSVRRRYFKLLAEAKTHIDNALSLLQNRQNFELVAEELKLGHNNLGDIVGNTSSDALLGHIFSSFCIGK